MNSTIKTAILLMSIFSGIIYMSGCSRPSSSSTNSTLLVGTWHEARSREIHVLNGTVTYDSTQTFPLGIEDIVFTSDGHLSSIITGNTFVTGTYTLNGNLISLYSPANPSVVAGIFQIQVLDAHNLKFVTTDTIGTSMPNPEMSYDTLSYTR